MAKKSTGKTTSRLRRKDAARTRPNRSGPDHINRNENSPSARRNPGGSQKSPEWVAETIQQSIASVVNSASSFIDQQIRQGQLAASRLRADLPSSPQLNADINNLVEGLVATTKDVMATWLDVLSIVLRSVGPQSPCAVPPADATADQTAAIQTRAGTTTRTGRSGSATTISSITPADPASPSVPPVIEATGVQVKSVKLDLRPPSPRFVPLVRPLDAGDRKPPLTGVRFDLSTDRSRAVLKVDVPSGQPAGTYTGAIVDSSTNEPGGTVSVTVGS